VGRIRIAVGRALGYEANPGLSVAVRRLADGFGHSRKTLLEVAENYDKLANNLEARLNRLAGLPTLMPS